MKGIFKIKGGEGFHLFFEIEHTIKEWEKAINNDFENYWNFPIEELLDGSIEPNKDMIYWLIEGRLYETPYTL